VKVAHVDMDAFYVSVELQRRPELRGLPVVVAGSGPRAVVTTASYEARRFGVVSATPAERARRLCPEAVFIAPDFDTYRARSREVMAVLKKHVERVEVVGLDEAYLDLTGLDRYRSAARRLKETVRAETGLTCSVGIGPNKLVAKVASDAEKPDGFLELTAEGARIRFAEASPGLVPGIGPKTVARLEELGIATLGRLGSTPDEQVVQWFGARLGPHLAALARFEDKRPSASRSRSRARPPSTVTFTASTSSSRCLSGSPASCARRSRARSGVGAPSASRSASTTSAPSRGRAASTPR
jgi:DNA polymerase-4